MSQDGTWLNADFAHIEPAERIRDDHFLRSGDVLFPNGHGRTDLPGGDGRQIERSIRQHHGNKTRAAKALGIDRRTLYRKLKEYGLDDGVERDAA